MSKVTIELVADVLCEIDIHPEKRDRIMRLLRRAAEREADEAAASREPTVPKQFVIVISDPRGEIPDEDFVGWVLQVPENDAPALAIDRIERAAAAYHATRRGSKYPAKSFGEACEVLGGKFLKEVNVSVKTKLPVTVLRTDNELHAPAGAVVHREDLKRSA